VCIFVISAVGFEPTAIVHCNSDSLSIFVPIYNDTQPNPPPPILVKPTIVKCSFINRCETLYRKVRFKFDIKRVAEVYRNVILCNLCC